MYLKKLEMKGFKSFADRTVLDFNDGVTCVVGPNGSGKSNITDAVRWVLGEQKVKTLRGSKMEDIIFSGTSHRSSLGLAEVSLHFDNESRFFPLDFTEIIITRRIYRSGESEYLLNGTACRLKDVRELFMDTGIGTDGYSIIGQGKIESILSTNGDDRRQVFEEAAGIVKYKARKREAVRKLENTELNLLRVDDIAHELKNRIEPLRKESEKAAIYLSLSEELKDLEINLFLNELDKVDQKLKKVSDQFAEKQSQQLDAREAHDDMQQLLHQQETQLFDVENAVGNCNERYVGISDAYRTSEGELSLTEEKLRNANTDLTRFEVEISHWNNTIENASNESTEIQTDFNLIDAELKALEVSSADVEKTYLELSASLVAIAQSNETSRQKIIEQLNQIERLRSDDRNHEENSKRYERRHAEIEEEKTSSEIAITQLNDAIQSATYEMNGKKDLLEKLAAKEQTLKTDMETKQNRYQADSAELQRGRVSEEKTRTELKVLKSMEASMEGFDYSVKTLVNWVMKNSEEKGYVGVIADLIQIPEEMETAIDIALGRGLQNVVCENEQTVKRYIDALKREKMGRVTFLPLSNLNVQNTEVAKELIGIDGYLGVASDLVAYESNVRPAIQYLLGRTLIFKDYDSASKALKVKSNRLRIVTLDGELLIPGGAITGGSIKQKASGVLNRKSKIAQLEQDLLEHDIQLKDMQEQLKLVQEDIQNTQESLKLMDVENRETASEIMKVELVLRELDGQKKQFDDRQTRWQREAADLLDEIKRIFEKREWIQQQLKTTNESIVEIESTMKSDDEKKHSVAAAFQEASDRKQAMAVRMAGEKERHDSLRRDIERLVQTIKQSRREIESRQNGINQVNLIKKELLIQKESLLIQKAQWQEELTAIKTELSQLSEGKETLRHALQQQNETLTGKAVALEKLSNELHSLELDLTRLNVEKENVVRTIEERYEMAVEQAAELKKDIDERIVNQRTRQIKGQLKEIGDVNVGSIKEYEEVTERYTFLKDQMDDLIKGQQTLKKIIKELDVTMKKQFVETFEAIRSNFGEVFRALFNGGTADLKILDEENVLESDIEIYAQPPGKRLQSLSLLSGGEKSLTAIALLFSTLKFKPAPFCMLDEIEAALDDVNVHRFAEFLKEFSDTSQFVIITHRKGTMEIADILYGVTMEEYGVSKIVSVKLEDVN